MIRPTELLEHARRLLVLPEPSQADLRRAVSTTYYGIFHLFALTSAERVFPGMDSAFQGLLLRTYDHRTMKEACRAFSEIHRKVPKELEEIVSAPADQRLSIAAKTFMNLQEARHRADYDVFLDFDPDEVEQLFTRAVAMAAWWDVIRALPETDVFLAMLLFGNRLLRRG